MSEESLSIAYLGPKGSFSELAAQARAREKEVAAEFQPVDTVADVFRQVEQNQVDEGIVPIENLLEGTLGGTLDVIRDADVSVCGEIELPVRFSLLSQAESVDEIETLYSHQVAFGQCRQWLFDLEERLGRRPRLLPEASTARAAQVAAKTPNAGAIAERSAAGIYQLRVLEDDIQDVQNNYTRFWVIGQTRAHKTGDDKTSLLVLLENKPGTLVRFLGVFQEHNLTMIQTRPIGKLPVPPPDDLWEYAFFMDYLGHKEDPPLYTALRKARGLRDAVRNLKVLGSYPCAKPADPPSTSEAR